MNGWQSDAKSIVEEPNIAKGYKRHEIVGNEDCPSPERTWYIKKRKEVFRKVPLWEFAPLRGSS